MKTKVFKKLVLAGLLFGAYSITHTAAVPPVNSSITMENPLIKAVEENNLALAELIISAYDTNPNQTDSSGNSALRIAAENGYEDIIYLLLETGAQCTESDVDYLLANHKIHEAKMLSDAYKKHTLILI